MRPIIALLLLLFAQPVWAMEHHTNVLTDNRGNAIKGATVYVYNAGTTTFATIFSDNGVTLKSNPFLTSSAANSPGAYDFYASNGVYDVVFVKSGYSFDNTLTKRIALFDVNDGGGGGGGGGGDFGSITSGTNTVASMIVSTGSTITYSGGGTINASTFRGNTIIPFANGGTNQTIWTASRCVHVNASGTALESTGSDCSVTAPGFDTLTSGTNVGATMTVGTGGALTYSGSGSINASTFRGNATIAVANGGTNLTTAVDDATIVGNGTTWQSRVLPSCSDASTSKLLYDISTNSFSCGTDQTGSASFDTLGSGTNVTSSFTVGTGGSLTYSGAGTINASTVHGNYPIAVADGGIGLSTAPDDTVVVGTGSGYASATLPSCNNPTFSKLLYDTTTNSFSCGTDQSSGGGTTFSTIASGTNTTAAMVVGSGGTLTPSGSGLIAASGLRPIVKTVNAGNSPYTALVTDSFLICDATTGARIITLPAATNVVAYQVKHLGSNSCTINRAGADTIDGTTSAVMNNPNSSLTIVSDGVSVWYVGG